MIDRSEFLGLVRRRLEPYARSVGMREASTDAEDTYVLVRYESSSRALTSRLLPLRMIG